MRHQRLFLYAICLCESLKVCSGFVVHCSRSTRLEKRCRSSRSGTTLLESDTDTREAAVHAPISVGDVVVEAKEQHFQFHHSSTVFIEMTDMYGIVYYANYITYALRAMERTFGVSTLTPNIHALHDMKYRAAATLGEIVTVSGNLVSCDLASGRSRWCFKITADDPSRVFVSAEATMSWPGVGALPPGIRSPPADQGVLAQLADTKLLQPLSVAFEDPPKCLDVVVWKGDMDAEGGELRVEAVLNYFERIRTLSLGRSVDSGELGLARLHREGVSVVVTNIADLRIDSKGVKAGDVLQVRLGAQLTRGARVITMYETLWTQDEALVAHAEIVLFCMDNGTRKFRTVPPWVVDILTVPSTDTAD